MEDEVKTAKKTAKTEHRIRKANRKLLIAGALKDTLDAESTVGMALLPIAQVIGAQLVDDIECGAEGVIVDPTFSTIQNKLSLIARLLA